LFQEQVFLHFPCSPSLLVLGATNLLPGTSSEGEHEKSELYLFSVQILTVSFRKKRRIIFRTINDSTRQKANAYVPGTSKEEQREVVPGTSKERKGKLFLEQVKRSRGELFLEQVKRSKG